MCDFFLGSHSHKVAIESGGVFQFRTDYSCLIAPFVEDFILVLLTVFVNLVNASSLHNIFEFII